MHFGASKRHETAMGRHTGCGAELQFRAANVGDW
jgi:hypothetical protein